MLDVLEPSGTSREGKTSEDMEEKGRRRDWESGIVGKKLEPWPKTGSALDASWKPYAPEGAIGNKSNSGERHAWGEGGAFECTPACSQFPIL
jgi:hypothetical protein